MDLLKVCLILFLVKQSCSISYEELSAERTALDVCSNQNSGLDECGANNTGLQFASEDSFFNNFYCACDADCGQFGDCCAGANSTNRETRDYECSKIGKAPSRFSILLKSSCSSDWKSKAPALVQKCEDGSDYISGIPVFSNTSRIMYKNLYCALCNDDADSLANWTSRMTCVDDYFREVNVELPKDAVQSAYNSTTKSWTFLLNETSYACSISITEFTFYTLTTQFNARLCRPAIRTCPEGSDPSLVNNCNSYTSFMFDEAKYQVVYENLHCALCNEVNTTQLTCKIPFDLSSYGVRTFDIRPSAWYPVLLDLNPFDSGGNVVGGNSICSISDGMKYDSLANKCVQLYCSEGFIWSASQTKCIHANSSLLGSQETNSTDSIGLNSTASSDSCSKIMLQAGEFVFMDNNTIFDNRTGKELNASQIEIRITNDNQTEVLICAYDFIDDNIFDIVQVQSILSQICLITSIVCLCLHLLVSCLISKLRNFPGKILISLSISILAAQTTFLFSGTPYPHSSSCIAVAVICHFAFMSSFFWSNVMAFDVYRTFNSMLGSDAERDRKLFIRYSLYAWLVPMAIIGVALMLDFVSETESVWQPLYGQRICWINQKAALLLFFALPLACVLLANICFFIWTVIVLIQSKKDVQMSPTSQDRIRFNLYLKLALIMGFTWIFGFLGSIPSGDAAYYLWFPFIIFNGLQGAFIFVSFTLKSNNYKELQDLFTKSTQSQSGRRTIDSQTIKSSALTLSSSSKISPSLQTVSTLN